ncbi:MAG: D-2-hydroxyacid dehydrogenase [Gemmatimonadota bacterium]|nr:D-2-hydroxyacid dehydrogenase [Gemmatimonadota bacterium]
MRLRHATLPGWQVRFTGTPAVSDGDGATPPTPEALAAIRDAEVYFGFGLSEPLFSAARRLRWVHSAAAGVGSALFPAMRESDVLLTNSAGVHATPIAEHVIGGILYLLRDFETALRLQRASEWSREPFVGPGSRVREIGECRAVIIGTGGIGGAIAERLSAFGARCVGIRRHPERGAPAGFDSVHSADDLPSLAAGATLLIVAAPATADTSGLVTATLLDRLPQGAIVCNVARGTLVDEEALAQRVADGRLRGAVLDVFRQEPLDSSSPLWSLPSVLLTPHVSAVSPRAFWGRELELFFDNWRRYVAGERLRNLVDKAAGY